jgi:Na+-transporting methylmalonyl-CoA/oxaloacetate decarboxylase gamma subunit
MGVIFFFLFTLIFVTSMIGDIKSKEKGQNIAEDQGS